MKYPDKFVQYSYKLMHGILLTLDNNTVQKHNNKEQSKTIRNVKCYCDQKALLHVFFLYILKLYLLSTPQVGNFRP